MSRRRQPPYLYLIQIRGKSPFYVIRDGTKQCRTGCGPAEFNEAQRKLAAYILSQQEARPVTRATELSDLAVPDVMRVYLEEHAPKVVNPSFITATADPIITFWGNQTLADIRAESCHRYVQWRTRAVSVTTARHDLKTLRAAINYYHAQYGPLPAVPKVTMPPKPPRKEDYWLTRQQVAARIRAARRLKLPHMVRLLLIGVYSGTRPGAILNLQWAPNKDGGYLDLEKRIIYRAAIEKVQTKKRQTKARIHDRLYAHLVRWHKADAAKHLTHVITFRGEPMAKFRRSWLSVAIAAGQAVPSECKKFWLVNDGPHILRHTAVTWLVQAGVSYHETAGFVGMSVETIEKHYGHHSPEFQTRAASATTAAKHVTLPRKPMSRDRADGGGDAPVYK